LSHIVLLTIAVPYNTGSNTSRGFCLRIYSRQSLPMALWRRKTTQTVMKLSFIDYRLYQRFFYVTFVTDLVPR